MFLRGNFAVRRRRPNVHVPQATIRLAIALRPTARTVTTHLNRTGSDQVDVHDHHRPFRYPSRTYYDEDDEPDDDVTADEEDAPDEADADAEAEDDEDDDAV